MENCIANGGRFRIWGVWAAVLLLVAGCSHTQPEIVPGLRESDLARTGLRGRVRRVVTKEYEGKRESPSETHVVEYDTLGQAIFSSDYASYTDKPILEKRVVSKYENGLVREVSEERIFYRFYRNLYYYDAHGRTVREEEYYASDSARGELSDVTCYEYYREGDSIDRSVSRIGKIRPLRHVYVYNEEGKLVSRFLNNYRDSILHPVSAFKFDSVGRCIEEEEYDLLGKFKRRIPYRYIQDCEKSVIEKYYIVNDGEVLKERIEEYRSGGGRLVCTKEYDSDGRVDNSTEVFYTTNGELVWEKSYSNSIYRNVGNLKIYDVYGNLYQEESYSPSKRIDMYFRTMEVFDSYIYDYDYDKWGNWIKMVRYRRERRNPTVRVMESRVEREIEYFE